MNIEVRNAEGSKFKKQDNWLVSTFPRCLGVENIIVITHLIDPIVFHILNAHVLGHAGQPAPGMGILQEHPNMDPRCSACLGLLEHYHPF